MFTESHFGDSNMGDGVGDAGMSVRKGCAASRSRSALRRPVSLWSQEGAVGEVGAHPGAGRGRRGSPGASLLSSKPQTHERFIFLISDPTGHPTAMGLGRLWQPSPTGLAFMHLTLALRGSVNTHHSPSLFLCLCLLLPLSLLPTPCLGDSSVPLEKAFSPAYHPREGPDPNVSGRCSGNFLRILEPLVVFAVFRTLGLKTRALSFPLSRKGEGLSWG